MEPDRLRNKPNPPQDRMLFFYFILPLACVESVIHKSRVESCMTDSTHETILIWFFWCQRMSLLRQTLLQYFTPRCEGAQVEWVVGVLLAKDKSRAPYGKGGRTVRVKSTGSGHGLVCSGQTRNWRFHVQLWFRVDNTGNQQEPWWLQQTKDVGSLTMSSVIWLDSPLDS